MTEFNKNETQPFESGAGLGDNAVYRHIETGLTFANYGDGHFLHEHGFERLPDGTKLDVIKHVHLEGWKSGDDPEYYVQDINDIPKLFDLLRSPHNSLLDIVTSKEFIQAVIDKV